MQRMRRYGAATGALALAAALVAGAATGWAVLLVAVLLVQGLVVGGWHRSLDVPGAIGGGLVAGAACVAADLVVLVEQDGERPLAGVPAVLAMAVLGALAHQLARRDGRPRLNASMSATVTLAAFAGLAAAFLAVETADGGAPLAALAAVAGGLVVAGTQARRVLRGPGAADAGAVGLGVLGGLVVAAVTDLDAGTGLAVGLGCAVTAWTGTTLVARTAQPDPGVVAALPIALAAPVAYVLGRVLSG